MIKKDSIKKLIEQVIHKKVESELTSLGFKYAKSKSQFWKNVDKFKQIISISHYNASIEFDETKDLIQLQFRIASAIEIPRFEKWCEKEYGQKHRIYYRLNNFKYFYNLSEIELGILETYSPTKSQQFKANVSRAIAGNQKEDVISFDEIEKKGFQLFKSNLDLFCNPILMYENRRNENDISYIRMLEYLNELELAKKENIKSIEFWKAHMEKTEFRTISDRNLALTNYNKRIELINQRFSTNLQKWTENFSPFEIDNNSKKNISKKFITLELEVSVKKPSSKIIGYYKIDDDYFQIREDGSILKHHSNGQISSKYQVESFDKIPPYSINFSRKDNRIFVGDLVVEQTKTFPLEYKSQIEKNGTILPIPFSQVYDAKNNEFAFLISNYKKHEIHFCDELGKHSRFIELPERPIEIIPELEIILCEKQDKACQVYDLAGQFKYSMPSNNARYSFKNKYDYNLTSDLFLSGWYYTKSQLYNLTSGEFVKHLWAHPTNIKGYKEILYSNINHNFGMGQFKFSPKGDYIIGGADHGKYVAWTTKDIKRIELIPSQEYLSKLKDAVVIEIEGKQMLKNRGNHMGEIVFLNEGNLFGFQIGKDLLIWNKEFKHIETFEDIGYTKQIDLNLISVENEKNYNLYEINYCN
ncbi:MAG: hypothetical protein AAGA77_16035 [Bacteroidota bacterium]